jgi:DNA gyrase subunit B
MPAIITRGYLYIAQPPLFKVKKGKKEIYLKNEESLNGFIIETGTEELTLSTNGHALTGEQLERLVRLSARYSRMLEQVGRRRNPHLVEAVLWGSRLRRSCLADEREIEAQLGDVLAYLEEHHPKILPVKLEQEWDEEHASHTIRCIPVQLGKEAAIVLDFDFFNSAEFEELVMLSERIREMAPPPYQVHRADTVVQASNPTELWAVVDEAGRKGLAIQRYKGLGEMNPEQLWETTMDPESRSLLQVRITEQAEADNVFTVLMGDAVEPRRDFIETNALMVRNLDI